MNVASPAVGLKAILDAHPLYEAPNSNAWDLTIGKLLDKNNTCAIMDTGAISSEPRLAIDYPTVQFLCQGSPDVAAYTESRAVLQKVFDLLVGISAAPALFPELTAVNARGGIQWLGYSDKERPQWSLNLSLILEPVPAAYSHRVAL
jgi:hypothetical protein